MNGNMSIPIYEKGKRQYTKEEIVSILLGHKRLTSCNKICTEQASNIPGNMTFVVNLENMSNSNDVSCDDMGAYEQHGSPVEYVKVSYEQEEIKSITTSRRKIEDIPEDCELYKLTRRYGRCKSSPDVRRMIAKLVRVDHDIARCCAIHFRRRGT